MSAVYIIAEAGVNHNGDFDMAKDLVRVAARAGADAVKFQTFKAEELVTTEAPKAEYQKNNDGAMTSQFEMIKRLELPYEWHFELQKLAHQLNIEFLSSPFDVSSLRFLTRDLNIPILKIPSGEITNALFLFEAGLSNKKLILSTGMSRIEDIGRALDVVCWGRLKRVNPKAADEMLGFHKTAEAQKFLKEQMTILHCTTDYPAKMEDVNLAAMNTIASTFGTDVGYSDHTQGIHVSVAAVARGAKLIEKHFTLSRTLPGPDHTASLEPDELSHLVKQCRDVALCIGDGVKAPRPSELQYVPVVRRSLVAKQDIQKGEALTAENIGVKRAGGGLSPFEYWRILGTPSNRTYKKDEALQE